MTASRDRKEAAKRLGFALTADHRRLIDATGEAEIIQASTVLGQNFNDNIDFICWVLREYGGVDQMPFQPRRKPLNGAAALPVLPAELTGQDK